MHNQQEKNPDLQRRSLIKASLLTPFAAGALTATTAIPSPAAASGKEFVNWAGNVKGKPRQIVSPANRDELQIALAQAKILRVKGSGHSFNDIVYSDETLLTTDRLNRILWLDETKKQVKVEAGLKLKDLNTKLWEKGLAFPSLGDIAEQSMAGLVSTGTHGSGLKWGTFSDGRTLIGMEIILADGSLLELRADRPEDQSRLEIARLSLGSLGAIYSLTFQLVDAHFLEFHSEVVEAESVRDLAIFERFDHFDYIPFPFTQKVIAVSRHTTQQEAKGPLVHKWFNDVFLENGFLGLSLKIGSLLPSRTEKIMEILPKLSRPETFVGRSYEVMTSIRTTKFYEMEYCVDFEKANDAVAIYHDINDFYAKRAPEGDRYFANFPGIVRATGGDEGTALSATLGRPSAYVGNHIFPDYGPGYEKYLQTMEEEFQRIGGRPHWGKLFYKNPAHLYPRFHDFALLREELDPQGKFINPYLRRLLEG